MRIRKDAEERRVFLYVIMRLFHLRDADVGVDHEDREYDAGNMIEYWKGCTGRTLDSLRLEVSGY